MAEDESLGEMVDRWALEQAIEDSNALDDGLAFGLEIPAAKRTLVEVNEYGGKLGDAAREYWGDGILGSTLGFLGDITSPSAGTKELIYSDGSKVLTPANPTTWELGLEGFGSIAGGKAYKRLFRKPAVAVAPKLTKVTTRVFGDKIVVRAAEGALDGKIKNGDLFIEFYQVGREFAGNHFGTSLIREAIKNAGSRISSVSARLGGKNDIVYRATGDIWKTPLGRAMRELGFNTYENLGTDFIFR